MKKKNASVNQFWFYGFLIFMALACKKQVPIDFSLSTQQWIEDLDFLEKTIRKKHPNPFNFIAEAAFLSKLEKAKQDLRSNSSAVAGMLEIEQLAAAIGDGHTWASQGFDTDLYLLAPIYLRWFEDGIRVVGIEAEQQAYLGWYLQKVNDLPVDEALARVQSFIPQNENRYYRQYWETYWLRNLDALFYKKIGTTNQAVTYTFCTKDGACQSITLQSKKEPAATANLHYAYQPVPFFMSNAGAKIWYKALNEQVFYIKVNQYPNESETLKIGNEIYNALKSKVYQKIIFDFRINGGGNKDRVETIINAIYKEHPQAQYFALVGDHSFSAALANAVYLKEKCAAFIVGEPPTNRPNFYAENFFTTLPNSKIKLSVATRQYHFQAGNAAELQLDQYIPRSFEAYQKGKDPTLKWVLEY